MFRWISLWELPNDINDIRTDIIWVYIMPEQLTPFSPQIITLREKNQPTQRAKEWFDVVLTKHLLGWILTFDIVTGSFTGSKVCPRHDSKAGLFLLSTHLSVSLSDSISSIHYFYCVTSLPRTLTPSVYSLSFSTVPLCGQLPQTTALC